MKTIDIQAKEWFDKVNGNSYFSAVATIDFGKETEKQINIPFQYGYGDHYIYQTFHELQTGGFLPANETIYSPSRWTREKGIELRTSKKENCLKREVKNFEA